jgi:hypothetical protein
MGFPFRDADAAGSGVGSRGSQSRGRLGDEPVGVRRRGTSSRGGGRREEAAGSWGEG